MKTKNILVNKLFLVSIFMLFSFQHEPSFRFFRVELCTKNKIVGIQRELGFIYNDIEIIDYKINQNDKVELTVNFKRPIEEKKENINVYLATFDYSTLEGKLIKKIARIKKNNKRDILFTFDKEMHIVIVVKGSNEGSVYKFY